VVLMKKPKSEQEPSPEAHPGQREDKIIGEAIQSATRAQESLAGLLQCFDQCAAHIRSEVATMRIAIDDLNGQRKRRSLQGPL
jgi:phospholipase/lecithinase/hemolysin